MNHNEKRNCEKKREKKCKRIMLSLFKYKCLDAFVML